MMVELIVVGGTPAGLSVAVEAARSGLESALVVVPEAGDLSVGWLPDQPLRIAYPGPLRRIAPRPGGGVVVESETESFAAGVCVLDTTGRTAQGPPPWDVPPSVAGRVHTSIDFEGRDQDVLVVGPGEAAAVTTWRLAEARARPVLCFTGELDSLSLVARQLLEHLEVRQEATIFWRTAPDEVLDVGGYPMAVFDDRRTPDLQFDHVLAAEEGRWEPEDLEVSGGPADGLLVVARPPGEGELAPGMVWPEVRRRHFPEVAVTRSGEPPEPDTDRIRRLRSEHYNATITSFDTAHNELWRIQVKPDRPGLAHRAGQYCTLGLGYWEPRADDAVDPGLDSKRERLVRRSYSISSPIFDSHGYLVDHAELDEVELYVVWVRADADKVPGLTPRLSLKRPGDRIYLGPKVVGRYTLDPVIDPAAPLLFCATGTGEAPHNAMIVELLRKGHTGPILSAVSVRYRSDLAYLAEHRRLEERFANYRYLPQPTREADVPKRYLQDLLEDGTLEETLGTSLDPATTHLFLCGNPAMIGLPRWEDDRPAFPEPVGMAELLHRRGFVLDRRGVAGNVHYEEYW